MKIEKNGDMDTDVAGGAEEAHVSNSQSHSVMNQIYSYIQHSRAISCLGNSVCVAVGS